jgi:hypothetical protein
MLPQERINNIWYSGYCDAAVNACATTDLNLHGERTRKEWMANHVTNCTECTFANHLKQIEAEVADCLGIVGMTTFASGGDVLTLEGGTEIATEILEREIAKGTLGSKFRSTFIPWMEGVKKRHGLDFATRLPSRW